MSGFKLLAIRPLKDCDSGFKKNLNEGEIYKFYQDYKFLDNDKNEISKNNENQNADVAQVIFSQNEINIFSDKNTPLEINISAIVGKNGSGKSTLIELLYVSGYLLALEGKILEINTDYNPSTDKTSLYDAIGRIDTNVKDLKKEILYYFENNKQKNENLIKLRKKVSQLNWNEKRLEFLKKLELEIPRIREKLKVEIFYQLGDRIIMFKFPSKKNIYFKTLNNGSEINDATSLSELSKHFFYSLVLNYSHYALNSNEIGVWIQELFHKNDAYQTPIVINPMRTEGVFDINTENNLVRQRLLANVLLPLNEKQKSEDSLRNLAKGRVAYRIQLEFLIDKFKNDIGEVELTIKKNSKHWKHWKLIEGKFNLNNDNRITTEYDEYAMQYIINKLISIAEKYPPYYDYVDLDLKTFDKYLNEIISDSSHIAYKFHQAINFLKYDYATTFSKAVKNALNIDVMANNIYTYNEKNQLIHCVPPSFFRIELFFDNYKDSNNILSNLSSGEKQHIYTISSIMYHLRNLDSVKTKHGIKHKYHNVNLIFDEIELYYHPELQRNFINDLLSSIKNCNLDPENGVKSLNCVLITHSPFILSDIPNQNVLSLSTENNEVEVQQTFGANIHDLLIDNFFMSSTIGEYAQSKIKEIVDFYYEVKSSDFEDKELKEEYKSKRQRFHYIVDVLGDEVIKSILKNHVDYIEFHLGVDNQKDRIKELEEEIMFKRAEIERLQKK